MAPPGPSSSCVISDAVGGGRSGQAASGTATTSGDEASLYPLCTRACGGTVTCDGTAEAVP